MARLLLGKEVNAALNQEVTARCEKLKSEGVHPTLAIVRCGEDAAALSYERGALKRAETLGVQTQVTVFPETVTKDELIRGIRALNENPAVHGVLLFRPLPGALRKEEEEICNSLFPEKDVDCMTDLSNAGVYAGKDLGYPPCTPEAVIRILKHYDIELTGKNICVIGRSLVVGKPVSMMLLKENATVTICHTRTVGLAAIAQAADIIVSAAGAAGSLTKDFVRPGQVVIDVSVNWDPKKNDGRGGITGDAAADEIEPLVDSFTPVPGGVGAVTTSVLLEHVVRAAEKAHAQKQ
ncbi:MAG: bifunctional 5,10-methylenetetrahydrofolate dehydrogenase/5,10-methenyltetrahydrofolate cyclohydrolase [Lachnospiraceae bacterium]|nr:bifunctional 5,10-methylenetetrahydrofolate dehydrogenase/5,10-methenyltetrahydrofolate cyclohydrolase [Lachnospiraceae bacterium]